MGIARRVARRSVRRAVGPSVWKATHPVSTAKRAMIPAPVRKARRMVHVATNPIGAAQNVMVNSVFRSFDDYNRSKASTYSRSYSQTTAGFYVGEREAIGIESESMIEELMKVERERFQAVTRPMISDPDPVSSKPFYDVEMKRRKKEYKFYQFALKKQISEDSWQLANQQAEVQHQELIKLRDTEQAKADAWWKQLCEGDQQTLTDALKLAFSDNQAPVIIQKAKGSEASFILYLPDINVLPEKRMNITPTGRVSSKKWTIAEKNEVYGQLLGAHLIATLRETWAVAPSLTKVRIIGVDQHRATGEGTLFDVTVLREDGRWEDDGWGEMILAMAEIGLNLKGKSGEIIPWTAKQHPVDL